MSQPVQYQNGDVEFFGRMFFTDPRALIPRFETEFLVSKTIAWCAQRNPRRAWSIIDIGTGSGVIAISLALDLPDTSIAAIDASKSALALARKNALKHNVMDRVHFIQGDLLAEFNGHVDIVVANLPYLPTERISKLDASVRDFEPHQALDGGVDGLESYRQLFGQLARRSCRPSLCVFEIDDEQENGARKEVAKWLPDARISIVKDTSDFVRYVVLEFNKDQHGSNA